MNASCMNKVQGAFFIKYLKFIVDSSNIKEYYHFIQILPIKLGLRKRGVKKGK